MGITSLIIDGYNVIGTIHKNLEKVREELIDDLSKYSRVKGHDVTVVFDGYKSNQHQSWGQRGGIEVVYSGHGEDADTLIKRTIKQQKKRYIVITSDRDIATFAWANDCVPVRAEVFVRKMEQAIDRLAAKPEALPDINSPYDNITFDYECDEDDRVLKNKKGNARILSKKDKIIKNALDKL
ncbi:NYN domain-containing protein [Candidatus Magnetomonas plexicatena]|uniref:NYN domain-containing protein n=1 Tax=Candidatus Magnetomonas plexicatena TaxID=2552947 RepID=UPI001C760DFB|nr:NYN domain-containing protein [Nitrospirales bacterium LBB_01]